MKMIEYLYSGMFLVSIILIYFAIKQYNNTKELLTTGIQTTAKVIDLIRISNDDGYTYKPVYEFIDNTGTKVTFKSSVSSSPTPYKVGDNVNIIYAKDSDKRKVISFWGLYRWTVILLAIAAPLLIIGGGYLLYKRG